MKLLFVCFFLTTTNKPNLFILFPLLNDANSKHTQHLLKMSTLDAGKIFSAKNLFLVSSAFNVIRSALYTQTHWTRKHRDKQHFQTPTARRVFNWANLKLLPLHFSLHRRVVITPSSSKSGQTHVYIVVYKWAVRISV